MMTDRRGFLEKCALGLGAVACVATTGLGTKEASAKTPETANDLNVMVHKAYLDVKISKDGVALSSKRNHFAPMHFTGMEATVVSAMISHQYPIKHLEANLMRSYGVDLLTAKQSIGRVLSALRSNKILIETKFSHKSKCGIFLKF